jgi:hypothetical protein
MQEKDIFDTRCSSKIEKVPFNSNCVKLSGREWIVVGIVALALFCFGPGLWERMEKFEPGPDYRLGYELSSDYRLYNRYCRWAVSKYETLVIGDSVVWGHFVSKDNTLSHYLNEAAGRDEFANLGVDGTHPAALSGLLKYYSRAISGKNVILHLNPLWMSSEKHDLQSKKEFHFNHPKLVPQFFPKILCYKDSYSRRISAVMERYVPLLSWTSHLKIAYFGNTDLSTWTMEHPYENPASAVTRLDAGFENQVPWSERGITKTDFQWVKLETSLQWKCFQRSVELLAERGNSVFVLVGPFNEHMMTDESLETYRENKSKIELWLQQNNIAYYMPAALPSELYVDASHPLSEGYAMLAKQLLENK